MLAYFKIKFRNEKKIFYFKLNFIELCKQQINIGTKFYKYTNIRIQINAKHYNVVTLIFMIKTCNYMKSITKEVQIFLQNTDHVLQAFLNLHWQFF